MSAQPVDVSMFHIVNILICRVCLLPGGQSLKLQNMDLTKTFIYTNFSYQVFLFVFREF